MQLGRMPPYGTEHVAMLVVLVAAAAAAVIWARRSGLTPRTERILSVAGWAYLVLSLAWSTWDLLPQNFTVEQSIPMHLSDVLRIITAIALITRAPLAIAISFYWGLTLNLQSIVTPDLNYITHPSIDFASYWIFHGLALIVPLVMVFGLGYRVTWRAYAWAFGSLLVWAGVAALVNTATGSNYGYLSHAPAGPSILDIMGGWPTYLLVEAVAILAVWALMTLPWAILQRRSPAPAVGRMRVMRLADSRRPEVVLRRADTNTGVPDRTARRLRGRHQRCDSRLHP